MISPNRGIELTKEYFLDDEILTCARKISWNERYSSRTMNALGTYLIIQ